MTAGADAGIVTRRLAGLAARYELTDGQIGQLRCVLEVLATDAHAPSTVTAARQAVDVHLADSLTALDLDVVRSARRLVDVGSGAGFPGLPLAVALPGAAVSLLESSARRCAFIERVASAAGVRNASVVGARVEAWEEGSGGQDVVTARAVAPLAVLCEYAAPLLRLGGALVVWRGHRDPEAEAAAERAAGDAGAREPHSGPERSRILVARNITCTST